MLSTCFALLWLWCTSIIISSVGCAIYTICSIESSNGRFINVRAVWETTVKMSNTLIRTKSVEYMYGPLFRFNRWLNHLVNNIECYIATAHTLTHNIVIELALKRLFLFIDSSLFACLAAPGWACSFTQNNMPHPPLNCVYQREKHAILRHSPLCHL